jgi:hypothetical protein
VLVLAGTRIIGQDEGGAVSLSGARIGSLLDCSGAELRNDSGPALDAHGLHGQSLYLTGFTATGSGERGAVNLVGARIGGLGCFGAELRNDSGPALDADGLQADQALYLTGGFTATGSGERGAVRLIGAHIGGLECSGAELRNDSGAALAADGLQVDQSLYLTGGFTATGGGEHGAVRLVGARVGGQLDCFGAELRNDSGPALTADNLQVGQDLFLHGGFTATGGGEGGAVSLAGAHVGGALDCSGLTATGGGEGGAVRLVGARVGGVLDCSGAELRNDSGPALAADRLQVDQALYLTGGFTATGGGEGSAVRLGGARIGGQLKCSGAELQNDSGPALAADNLQVGQDLYLTDGFTATGGGERGAVSLAEA